MKKIALLAVLMASSAMANDTAKTLEAQVKQANANLFGAMVRKDASTLNQRIADDAIFIGATVSKTDTKARFIALTLDPKESYESIIVDKPQVFLQKETAVVMGKVIVKATSERGTNHVRMSFTNVFIKRDKRWQLITSQTGFATDIKKAARQE